MLQLDISILKKMSGDVGPFQLSAALPPLELRGKHFHFTAPVESSLFARHDDSTVAVEGIVSGKITLCCDRCLKEYEYAFTIPFREAYAQEIPDGVEDLLPFKGDWVDLTPEVLKTIILSLPMKMLCCEDCLGLCSKCGADLNENRCGCSDESMDPRFSALQDFFKGTS